jgi:hypothetical protein
MSSQKPGKKPSAKGELRRRWRAFLEDGSMAKLRSEGRLVALYVLQVADWSTCEVRFSIRRAAACLRVHRNSVCRGISQLVETGILEILHKGSSGKSTKYRIAERPRAVYHAPTSGGRERPRGVDQAPTPRGRVDHEAWAQRLREVGAAPTGGGRNSVFSSGSPVRTSGDTSTADAGAGEEPARRRRPSRWIEGMPPPDAAAEAQEGLSVDASDTITQEVDA